MVKQSLNLPRSGTLADSAMEPEGKVLRKWVLKGTVEVAVRHKLGLEGQMGVDKGINMIEVYGMARRTGPWVVEGVTG